MLVTGTVFLSSFCPTACMLAKTERTVFQTSTSDTIRSSRFSDLNLILNLNLNVDLDLNHKSEKNITPLYCGFGISAHFSMVRGLNKIASKPAISAVFGIVAATENVNLVVGKQAEQT